MKLFYHPLQKRCKSSVGAVPRGSTITFTIYEQQGGEDTFSADSCALVLFRDGCPAREFPMEHQEGKWTIALRFPSVGLFFYHFRLGEELLVCGRLRQGILARTPENWQITVYDEEYETPDWVKGGVMYQIFPDRFAKEGDCPLGENKIMRSWGEEPFYSPDRNGKILNNDFFGGNFNGIRKRLDYLKALGVTVLYFNPIFEAYSNHRYDTGDYLKLDGLLGTEADFDALIAEADERGIKIILDGVFNHTGDDSRYFNRYGHYPTLGAYQSPDSPYADWYNFHPFPDEYDCWWGIRILPAVNEKSESYQNFIFGENGVIKNWLRHGIGGYRLDVADELPDFFLKKLRSTVKSEDPDAVIIGEVWEDASNKVAYGARREYFQGGELDSVMNYPLKDAIVNFILSGNTEQLRSTIAMLIDNYPPTALHSLMNILGTHDTPRILTVFGRKICTDKDEMARARLTEQERADATERLKAAAVLQYTLPGIPCIYYGDENGMEGYADPFCRRCFDWDHLNEELIGFYRKLGKIRKKLNDVFKDGDYREIFADFSCLVFERRSKGKSVYVYVNRSDSEYKISFSGKYREQLTGKTFLNKLFIPPRAYGIITRTVES